MNTIDEIARTIEEVARAFDSIQVVWAIGGSLASATYGEPRATNDIDVVALLTPELARQFANELGEAFYADDEAAADAASRRQSFNVIDQRTFIKVDVFVPAPGAMGQGQVVRRRHIHLFAEHPRVPVLGPEDIILQKLRWYETGKRVSDRQWRDILSVLRLAPEALDDAYLDMVAAENGLTPLLEQARMQAKPK